MVELGAYPTSELLQVNVIDIENILTRRCIVVIVPPSTRFGSLVVIRKGRLGSTSIMRRTRSQVKAAEQKPGNLLEMHLCEEGWSKSEDWLYFAVKSNLVMEKVGLGPFYNVVIECVRLREYHQSLVLNQARADIAIRTTRLAIKNWACRFTSRWKEKAAGLPSRLLFCSHAGYPERGGSNFGPKDHELRC